MFNALLKKHASNPTLEFEIENDTFIPTTYQLSDKEELITIQLAELDPIVLKSYEEAILYPYSKH